MNYAKAYKEVLKIWDGKRINHTLEYLREIDRALRVKKLIGNYLFNSVSSLITADIMDKAYSILNKADQNYEIEQMLINSYSDNGISKERDSLKEELFLLFMLVSNTSGQDAVYRVGSDKKFTLTSSSVIQDIRNHIDELFLLLDRTSLKNVSNKIIEAKDNLLTSSEAVSYVSEEIKGTALTRSDTTLSNEIARVMNNIQEEVYTRSGVDKYEWITSRSERVCPICKDLDGVISDSSGKFRGESIKPPIHVSCECFIVPLEVTVYNSSKVWIGN